VPKLFLFILDACLDEKHQLLILRVLYELARLQCFIVHAPLVQALCIVDSILIHVRVEPNQLFIDLCRLLEVLNVVVAIPKQTQGGARPRIDLKFLIQDLDDFLKSPVSDQGVDSRCELAFRNLPHRHLNLGVGMVTRF
jgi:hypothetical protein